MSTEANKSLITRYNKEVIEGGNMELLKEMVSPDFVNHSGVPGMPEGVDGLIYFFTGILHGAFSDIKVEIKDMFAEDNKVATRKEITAIHTMELMGIPASQKHVIIKVIDILAVNDGKITDHWGENNFFTVLQSLQA
ncbi:ester cyclase [Mucilaginibacter sp. Bleaf8]|uniref:ester cyclase n=1 Tax=Mucilaginibacter sp. Bleaf8 TaxID=2834430 RepID=UPI001BCE64CA|nr:ester cyclase [Mucilaginibacter sp. Bleaf8]MBS7562910.1 ester cyclase [Mucilaginibacter sp. Bleaf8]